jgi:hypothetical protein
LAAGEQDNFWIRWTPERIEGDGAFVYRDVAEAMADFKAEGDLTPLAVEWLTEKAVKSWPDSETWVYWGGKLQRIDAFFCVCKTDRLRTEASNFEQRFLPASEISWLCRHPRTTLSEESLLGKAFIAAGRLWPDQEVAVAIDPKAATTRLSRDYPALQKVPDCDLRWFLYKGSL